MSGPKTLLILHGKQALNEEVRAAVMAQRQLGRELAVRLTWEAGDARRLVLEALEAGYTTLVAGGGDGTLREVAEAMVETRTSASLALMPLGSANDFARAAGIAADPAEALMLLDAPAVAVDVGVMNEQLFINMTTGGFGSNVTANTSEELKKVLGGGAYLLSGLRRVAEMYSAYGQFKGPGFEWAGEFLAFGVGNGRQAGGGRLLCPQALADDGLLDVCIVPAAEDAVGTLGTLLSGGLLGVEAVSLNARLAWLEVVAPDAIDINLDGEPVSAATLRFGVRPGALRMHLPPDSPVLG